MRIMLDTNIIISIVLGSKSMNQLFRDICKRHTLVLSPYILQELREVVSEKFPKRKKCLKQFLTGISYELVEEKRRPEETFEIRDPKDIPVLNGAINGRVEILITGDKDFEDVTISNLKIMKPSEYQY